MWDGYWYSQEGKNPVLFGFIYVSQKGLWGTGIPVQIVSPYIKTWLCIAQDGITHVLTAMHPAGKT